LLNKKNYILYLIINKLIILFFFSFVLIPGGREDLSVCTGI